MDNLINNSTIQLINHYYIINKPQGIVSQFISPDEVGLLSDINFQFPEGTHAIGRLDSESEGLLILTTNKKITRILFNKEISHKRTYLVMVQNVVSERTLAVLKAGIPIRIKGGENYIATPHEIQIVDNAVAICPQATDPRERFPHTWLLITLTEGKFRQVRKMVLAARHRCLRLIRISMAGLTLEGILPGEVLELDETAFFQKAGLTPS